MNAGSLLVDDQGFAVNPTVSPLHYSSEFPALHSDPQGFMPRAEDGCITGRWPCVSSEYLKQVWHVLELYLFRGFLHLVCAQEGRTIGRCLCFGS